MDKKGEEFKIKISKDEQEKLYVRIAVSLIEKFYNQGDISLRTMNAIREDAEKMIDKIS